jgi:hypothetical protein
MNLIDSIGKTVMGMFGIRPTPPPYVPQAQKYIPPTYRTQSDKPQPQPAPQSGTIKSAFANKVALQSRR